MFIVLFPFLFIVRQRSKPFREGGFRASACSHWIAIKDEVEAYLESPVERTNDTPECRVSRSKQYPLLHNFALNMPSIPAMFAEAEPVFSRAKRTIS